MLVYSVPLYRYCWYFCVLLSTTCDHYYSMCTDSDGSCACMGVHVCVGGCAHGCMCVGGCVHVCV